MKHFILTLTLFSIIFGSASAQNTKKEKKSVSYMQMPLQPLPANINSYNVIDEIAPLSPDQNRGVMMRQIQSLHLSGYKKESNNPDIEIKFIIESFGNNWGDLLSRETEKKKKNADGSYSKYTITEYSYQIDYKYPMRLIITDLANNSVIDDFYVRYSQDWKSANTPWTPNSSDAWKNRKPTLANVRQQIFDANIKEAQAHLDDLYGFPVMTQSIDIYYIKSRKMNYDDYETARDKALYAYADYKPTQELNTSFEAKIKEAIAIWDKALTESDPDNRKARIDKKVTMVTYYNLVVASYFLNDFQKARVYINQAKDVDDKEWWYNFWENAINERERRFQANGLL